MIVDESHNFCNKSAGKFDDLQRITKSPRANPGLIPGRRKKVMLLSATPLKNGPEDLKNQMLFFQDERRCTIGSVTSLADYFAPKIAEYNRLQKKRKDGDPDGSAQARVDAIYSDIQHDLLDKITVRRTRHNLLNDPGYAEDLKKQGVVFPKIAPPDRLVYELPPELERLFWDTRGRLISDVSYARYRAIEFFTDEAARKKYPRAQQIAGILRGVYQTHMVKRLESSFHAFRTSLRTFARVTQDMIDMFEKDKVLVIPELDIKSELAKGVELDEIIEKALARFGAKYKSRADLCYPASAFDPAFPNMLRRDLDILEDLIGKWDAVDEDPKLDLFLAKVGGEFFRKSVNKSGKLVVFSESVDTLEYLREKLDRDDVLLVHSGNASKLRARIRANFDANAPADERLDDVRILLCSDALAEGVNLHRANVIVNYDTPWNVTRLMQRIGRVNRIGSAAGEIRNFLFYPSEQGDKAIGLYQNSLLKMQGFHSALGEDAQIFSVEEIVKEFQLFDPDVKDETDDTLRLLRIVRDLYANHPDDYRRIKDLPPKCRVLRKARADKRGSVVHLRSSRKSGFYRVCDGAAAPIDFLSAASLLEARKDEKTVPFSGAPEVAAGHYRDVTLALDAFRREAETGDAAAAPSAPSLHAIGGHASQALKAASKFLGNVALWIAQGALPPGLRPICSDLSEALAAGTHAHLEFALRDLAATLPKKKGPVPPDAVAAIEAPLRDIHATYCSASAPARLPDGESDPVVVLSETFAP